MCINIRDEINNKFPDSAISIPCNINEKKELENLVNKTNSIFGGIDILVCNAALNPFFGSSMDIPDDAFDKILSANIKSNHWLSNMVLPQMIERKEGSIIVISSIGGLKGSEMLGAYSISKAADMQLVRNIAVEQGPNNIRANCISPGIIKTRFAKALWDNPEILKNTTSKAPLRRIGAPDEVAGAAIFLASDAGSFTTGQNIVIDGGVTIA
jgi:NAD(P)-dependent dehydrogenase (short-subunit alcohol dehydrogenase family)